MLIKDTTNCLQDKEEEEVTLTTNDNNIPILLSIYSKESIKITTYLIILKKPQRIKTIKFKAFK